MGFLSDIAKVAAPVAQIAGVATGQPWLTAAGTALGGLGGSPNVSGAYGGASAQQMQAYQNAQFRPVGITNTFGQSTFQIDPNTGQLTGAGYALNPQLQGLQSSLLGGFGGALQQAQGVNTSALNQGANTLFGLGQSYLGQTPQEVQQNYVNTQLGLLRPEFEQASANLRNRQFATGRGGLATGGTVAGYGAGAPGLAQTNPEQAALANAYARAVANITAQAPAEAQKQITFGQGLLTGGAGLQSTGFGLQAAAYDPLKAQLGIGSYIEDLGAKSLGIGSELGGRASTAGAQAGQLANASAVTGLAGQIAQQGIDATRQTNFQNQLTGLLSNKQVQQGLGNFGSSIGSWFDSIIGGGPELLNWE